MESKVFYSCFAANFSAISSRCSKVCFSSGYQDYFFAGYDFFRAIVYDTIPVDNHRQTGIEISCIPRNLIIVIFYYQISLKPLKTLSLSQVSFPLLFPLYYIVPPHQCLRTLIRANTRARKSYKTV